jgi:hypothetical protein
MLVRFNAQIDTTTGILTYSFISLDPVTKGNIDENAAIGFLPPNTTHPVGNGSVSFSVALKTTLPHNDIVSDRASIIFDKNRPILTNTWSNKLDKVEPVVMWPGTRLKDDTTLVLKFTGTDDGSGIQYYGILCSTNNGRVRYLGNVYGDSVTLSGRYDSSYKFYVMPVDNVSNVGDSVMASVKLQLQQALQNSKLLVYPNPVKGKVSILFSSPEQQQVTVNIYAITGQLLATLYNATASGLVTLTPNLGKLSNGIYILNIKGSKGLKLQSKIIIQH